MGRARRASAARGWGESGRRGNGADYRSIVVATAGTGRGRNWREALTRRQPSCAWLPVQAPAAGPVRGSPPLPPQVLELDEVPPRVLELHARASLRRGRVGKRGGKKVSGRYLAGARAAGKVERRASAGKTRWIAPRRRFVAGGVLTALKWSGGARPRPRATQPPHGNSRRSLRHPTRLNRRLTNHGSRDYAIDNPSVGPGPRGGSRAAKGVLTSEL